MADSRVTDGREVAARVLSTGRAPGVSAGPEPG